MLKIMDLQRRAKEAAMKGDFQKAQQLADQVRKLQSQKTKK
jgi:protein-arginine kinase activator protein McsA